ncbi:MAG TPA: type IV toxin-antitoxin system AbiEi family antitoxin domain-containing protein [Mycobacteriales bacterium]|nr:type IV toxin-antitoxin system AbiEi family antitoxin domain-containing protein [Mycobacteriales bacterium]
MARALACMQRQGGVLTRRQALACGLTGAQVDTLLRRGTWTAPARGVYAASVSDDVGAVHAVAVAARARLHKDPHAGCCRSAALVLGVPLLGRSPAVPQLVRAPRGARDTASQPGIHVAALAADDVFRCRGVLVTVPARTVVDIARTSSFREAVVVADAVLHAGVPRADLEEQLRRCAGWPGAEAAARVVAFADERAESPLESLDRVAFADGGLPAPLTQVDVVGPRGDWLARCDFVLVRERTVVEADGLAKYRMAEGTPVPAWAQDALVKEKQREMGLRAVALEVARNGWAEAFHRPGELCERVRQHIWLASRYPAVPGVRFEQRPVRRRAPLTWPLGTAAA